VLSVALAAELLIVLNLDPQGLASARLMAADAAIKTAKNMAQKLMYKTIK
jgi:hypothetical protein